MTEGDRARQCCLLVQGILHRYKSLLDGKKAVLSFHVPGDIPDLQSLFLPVLDNSIGAATASQVALISHVALYELIAARPAIMAALWRETLIEAANARARTVSLGFRPARVCLAHLICELFDRLRSVDLAEEERFRLLLTQTEIGEAIGLSSVHVNRSLQELRCAKLIATEGRFLRILDWPGLQSFAQYEAYRCFASDAEALRAVGDYVSCKPGALAL